jgi:hypothetical protein
MLAVCCTQQLQLALRAQAQPLLQHATAAVALHDVALAHTSAHLCSNYMNCHNSMRQRPRPGFPLPPLPPRFLPGFDLGGPRGLLGGWANCFSVSASWCSSIASSRACTVSATAMRVLRTFASFLALRSGATLKANTGDLARWATLMSLSVMGPTPASTTCVGSNSTQQQKDVSTVWCQRNSWLWSYDRVHSLLQSSQRCSSDS